MKNVVKRATCVIFALVLLLTSSVYAVNDLNELTFRGTISTDLENPELLNLDEIEIKIYQPTPIETEESFTLYSDSYAFSVYPDENGIFTFERPTPTFSLTIEVGSLPDGYGLDQHTRLYSSEITSDIFKLSAVDRAEIVADSLKYPGIKLFNADGEEVYATYDFNPTYRAFSQNDDVVEICGTVNLNGNIIYSVSSNVALPEIDAIDKVDLLYDLGAIDEVERIEKYIEIYEEGTSTSACATPIVDEILEFYASDEYQAAPMSVKTKIEDLFQTPEEVAYVFPKAVSNTFFTVHYDDSVTETVAQDTLKYLTSLRNTVLSLGFNEPINENGKTSLQVYITSLKNSNCNGETYHSEDSSKSSWSRIFIYNLNNLSPGDKETIAHEYFHAVQNTYYKYNGWFKEAAAVWFAAKYSGSISRAQSHFNKYFANSERSIQDISYGNGVLPMAIDVAYGGSNTIRKIYEVMKISGSQGMSETQLRNIITAGIRQFDVNGSFAEAFKKLGAYITLPKHFFAGVIPINATWNNSKINIYTPTASSTSRSITLEGFGLKAYHLRANNNITPQDLNVIIDFSGSSSTTNSVRFVKKTVSGSITPFGTDATNSRYSAVINRFGFATASATNIADVYVAPINAGDSNRTATVTYQLAG